MKWVRQDFACTQETTPCLPLITWADVGTAESGVNIVRILESQWAGVLHGEVHFEHLGGYLRAGMVRILCDKGHDWS